MIPDKNEWKEVSKKTQPCPLCDHYDWCYLAENGEAVVCGRTDINSPPLGWRYLKDAIDGRAIFVVEKEKQKVVENKHTATKTNSSPHSNAQRFRSSPLKEIRLARLPHIPSDRPLPKGNK